MLVSKIKPCMCECKLFYRRTANGSLNQLEVYLVKVYCYRIPVVILELIREKIGGPHGTPALIRYRSAKLMVTHDNFTNEHSCSYSIRLSALSTFDGRIEAYHGVHG